MASERDREVHTGSIPTGRARERGTTSNPRARTVPAFAPPTRTAPAPSRGAGRVAR